MNTIPETVEQLNGWLRVSFAVADGPPRGYFELPFNYKVQDVSFRYVFRIVYIALCLSGREEDCVKAMHQVLSALPTEEQRADGTEVIFLRRQFEYAQENLYGRLAFWEPEHNTKLIASVAYKPEGLTPNKVQRPKEKA